jgi:MFS family permease
MSSGHSIWNALRHRHFRNVWLAAFVSSMGGWMEVVGVQWAMAQATLDQSWVSRNMPGAPIMMAYLAVAQLAPQLVLGLVGGVVADMVDRKRLLILTQFARMVIAIGLFVVAFRGNISPYMLILLGALDGVAMAFNIPAWQVLTPRLVPREDLTAAITLNGLQFNLARALGPALGGILLGFSVIALVDHVAHWIPGSANFLAWLHGYSAYDIKGTALLFLLNAISYLAVLIAVARTPASPAVPKDQRGHPWQLIKEAARFAWHNRGTRNLIIGITIFSALATPLIRFLPILVKQIYLPTASDVDRERGYGALLGVMGMGAVMGALTIRFVPVWYPKHHFVPLSITLCGLFLCLFSAVTSLYFAGIAIFLVGIVWMWSFNSAFAALQLLIPDRLRGRVLAIGNTVSFGFMPLGALLGGVIGEYVAGKSATNPSAEGLGAQVGLGVLSVMLTIVGFVMLTWRTPEIDGVTREQPEYENKPGLVRGITAAAHRPAAPRESASNDAAI